MKKILFGFTIFLIVCIGSIIIKKNLSSSSSNSKLDNPSSIPEKHGEDEEESIEEKAYSAEQRWKWEYDMLKNPKTGFIPKEAKELSLKQAKESPVFGLERNDANITITPRGPNNLGGRTRAIAFDTRNANIMLAGGVSSGVFRSINGGGSWTKVSSNSEVHNVTAIAQDTRAGHEDTWYYGTGEMTGNSASLGAFYHGHGIWKSTDNGITWTVLGSTQGSFQSWDEDFDFVHRIVVDPTNGYVYAAAADVIQRSIDGGSTWNIVLGSSTIFVPTDIVVTSTGRLYAAFHGSDGSQGVWTSTTGASGSWTQIAGGGTPTGWNAAGTYGRVVLAIAPSNEDKLFALYYNNSSSNCSGTPAPEAELFVYSQSGNSWTDLSANLPDEGGCSNGNDPFACQGGYDLCIAVKPNDENTVFIGGTNAYRSTDGFTSTSNTTRIGGYASPVNYTQYANHHPDVHYLTFSPGDNNTIFSGTDGGVAKADITATPVAWTELNTDYVTYQYYHVDIEPANGSSAVIGGAQDNGITECSTGTTHSESFGGDGCAVGVISYTNSSNYNIIASSQNGALYRFVANGGFGSSIRPLGSGPSIFVTYFHLDQDNTNYLYYADGVKLYRTRIASTITSSTVTGDASTGWEQMTGISLSGNIRSLATCRNDAHSGQSYSASDANRRLYIGTADGKIFRLDDPAFVSAATVPTEITDCSQMTPTTPCSGIVSGISVNAQDQNEILATWANYGINSAFHTTNANIGSPTWSNVEGNISASSFRSCAIAPGNGNKILYFVGTENGLYCTNTLNGGSTSWSIVGSSTIGYAVCSSMRYRPSDYNLLVGTHGNGMFQLDVSAAVLPVELITFKAKAEERGNRLTWSTASEVNNDYFQIEFSQDGIYYNDLERIPGSSESFERLDYDFLHKEAKPGLNYYRLLQIDLDGRTHNLGVKVVEREADIAIAIEPNPVAESLNLRLEYPSENNGQVDIFNLNGQLVYSEKMLVQEGIGNYQFNIGELPSGNYFLRIQIGREQFSERFIKD